MLNKNFNGLVFETLSLNISFAENGHLEALELIRKPHTDQSPIVQYEQESLIQTKIQF